MRIWLARAWHLWVAVSLTTLKMLYWLMMICIVFISLFAAALGGGRERE